MRRHRQLIATTALATFATFAVACGTDTFVATDASSDATAPDAPGSDGGAPDAAGPDAAQDAGVSSDAAPDALPLPVQPISCGQATCTIGETCCVYTSTATDGGLAVSTSCQTQCPGPSGGQQLAELGCTSTADCGSNVCCIHRQNGVDVSACQQACISSNNDVQLCDPQAADAGCPSNAPCSTTNIADWNLPATFATCGGQGVP